MLKFALAPFRVGRELDGMIDDFIENAPDTMARAKYSAARERSVGLGIMGFHSYLQSKMIPFESVMAKVWNKKMFEHIRKGADAASIKLGEERGPCPDAADFGSKERFSNKIFLSLITAADPAIFPKGRCVIQR